MTESGVKERVEDAVSKGKRRFALEEPPAAEAGGLVGIVRGALRAFGEGDHDAFLDVLSEDVTWEAPDGEHFPGKGRQSGCDAVRERFVADIDRTYTEFGFRPESFLDAADDEDAVVTVGRFVGKGVQGDTLDAPGVQIWDFKGNTATRVRIITDTAQFPEVITEDKQRELEEEDREKESEDKEAEAKKKDPEGKSESDAEGKSEDEGKDASESKNDDSDSE